MYGFLWFIFATAAVMLPVPLLLYLLGGVSGWEAAALFAGLLSTMVVCAIGIGIMDRLAPRQRGPKPGSWAATHSRHSTPAATPDDPDDPLSFLR